MPWMWIICFWTGLDNFVFIINFTTLCFCVLLIYHDRCMIRFIWYFIIFSATRKNIGMSANPLFTIQKHIHDSIFFVTDKWKTKYWQYSTDFFSYDNCFYCGYKWVPITFIKSAVVITFDSYYFPNNETLFFDLLIMFSIV